MTTDARPNYTRRQRIDIFDQNGGICYLCDGKIAVGEAWEIEHPIAIKLGGKSRGQEKIAHVKCHKTKTRRDVKVIAKTLRQRARHLGIRKGTRPMPLGRNSAFKRKINGEIVRR